MFALISMRKATKIKSETLPGNQLLQVTKARDETPSKPSQAENRVFTSEQKIKMHSVRVVMERSPGIRKESNASCSRSDVVSSRSCDPVTFACDFCLEN
jgi:hypothetical protein